MEGKPVSESPLSVRDLMPGMDGVNLRVEVLSVSGPKRILTGRGVEHEVLEGEVRDETGSIGLVLWDDKVVPLSAGDFLRIENGFVSSYKGKWKINVGRKGEVTKI